MQSQGKLIMTAALLVTLTACNDATGPEVGLSTEEAAEIAEVVDAASTFAIDGRAETVSGPSFSLSGRDLEQVSMPQSFDVTRNCPVGGSSTMAGTLDLNLDSEEYTIEMTVEAEHTFAGCTFRRRGGEDLTIDGVLTVDAFRGIVLMGGSTGTQSHKGTLEWSRSDGSSGTCEIDLTTTLSVNRGEGTRTVTGFLCGREVSRETSWPR